MSAPKQHNPGFLALVQDAKTRIREINMAECQRMLANHEPLVLIDVREESEWAAGHAAGAVHLGKGIIERDIESKVPRKDATLVLYCGGGYRSALVSDALGKMGYSRALSLDGGWRAYLASGLPVEK